MLNASLTSFPILTTKRLTLRQPVSDDDKEIFTLRSDGEINRYLDRPITGTIDEARRFITKVNQNISNKDALYWAITFTGKNILVGTICLFGFSYPNGKCEIGYELLANFQKQGIMKEALEKIVDYAFNVLKVKTIEAFLHRDNQSSIKLLDKLSFRKSKELDEANPDLLCYYLINSIESPK